MDNATLKALAASLGIDLDEEMMNEVHRQKAASDAKAQELRDIYHEEGKTLAIKTDESVYVDVKILQTILSDLAVRVLSTEVDATAQGLGDVLAFTVQAAYDEVDTRV